MLNKGINKNVIKYNFLNIYNIKKETFFLIKEKIYIFILASYKQLFNNKLT